MKRTSTRFIALLSALFFSSLFAEDATWDGDTNAFWSNLNNWDGPPAAVPGSGDIATFNNSSVTNTTVDLSGAVTVDQILFGGTPDAYTIGISGVDILTFSDNGNDPNFSLLSSVLEDQTIAADILMVDIDTSFDLDSTSAKLIITGDIDTDASTSGSIVRLEFGDFNNVDVGTVDVAGSISNTGGAVRIDLFVAGADVNLSGQVAGDTGNTMRTSVRDGSTLDVTSTGVVGQGSMQVRNGTLLLNNTTTPQFFDINLTLGNDTQGDGNARVTLAPSAQIDLNGDIYYRDDDDTVNVGLVQGGTISLDGGNRTFGADNHGSIAEISPELTITSTVTSDNSNRNLLVRNTDGGTLLLAPSGTANSYGGGLILQEGTLQLGTGGLTSGGNFLTISARNNAETLPDTVATVDLRGSTHTLSETNLNFGADGTGLIPDNGFQSSLIDSVGDGALTDVNQINMEMGDPANGGVHLNGGATLAADIYFDNSGNSKNIKIEDGEAEIDLTVTSDAALYTAAGETDDDFSIFGEGTLMISGTLGNNGVANSHDQVFIQNRKTILGPGANLGGQQNFVITQRNNTKWSNFPIEFDINGQTLVINDILILGGFNVPNVSLYQSSIVTDSAGGGRIRMLGTTENQNFLRFDGGNSSVSGGPNRTAYVEADVQFEGSNFNIEVADAADDVDMEISGTITDDTGSRIMSKTRPGVLKLTATDNQFGRINLNEGTLIFTNIGALGSDDIQLGSNTTDGILEYEGSGDTIDLQVRVGDGNAAAGRVGDGSIINSGTGGLTFSQGDFNQIYNAVTEPRTLTLGGDNTGGDNEIIGIIQDNNTAGGGTVGITKTGTNTWILSGANIYTGDTDVQAGRLEVNGSVGGNLTVANGASFGGDATFGGTVTLGSGGSPMNLYIDGTSGDALTATGAIDTSNGVTVFVDANGADGINILNYNGAAVGNNILTSHFSLDGSVVTSDRVGGAGPFVDTGSSITVDLGYDTRTWNNESTDGFWNEGTGSSENWVLAADKLFFDGDLVVFDDTPGTGPHTVTLNENVAPETVTFPDDAVEDYTIAAAGSETIAIGKQLIKSSDNGVIINAEITGPGSLYVGDNDGVQDASTYFLQLGAANSYTGGTTIAEGILRITHNDALSSGTVTLTEPGSGDNRDPILDLDQPSGFDFTNDVVMENDGGSKTIRFNNGGTNVGTLSGTITLNETRITNARIESEVGETLLVTGKITGPGNLMKRRAGLLILDNDANDFTGDLLAGDGTLEIASLGDSGVACRAGAGDGIILGLGATNTGNDRDGTLSYTGDGDSTDRQVQVGIVWFGSGGNETNGGTIANNGTGPLVFTNTQFTAQESRVAADIGPRILTLGGSFTGINEIDGAILDNEATDSFTDETVGVTVDTSGTWQLDGTNLYTGPTTVNSGTLLVNGSTHASSPVAVNGGTLGGSGTIGGSVAASGGATVAPGNSVGQLSTGDLTLAGGILEIEATGSGTAGVDYDQVAVSGTVDVAGAELRVIGNKDLTAGTLTIIDNDGTGDAVTDSFAGQTTMLVAGGSTGILETSVSTSGGDGNDVVVSLTEVTTDRNTDSDGIVDFLEFAVGLDAYNTDTQTELTVDKSANSGAGSFTPGTQKTFVELGPFDFKAQFVRRVDHEEAGITYTVQFNDDLADDWVNSTATPTRVKGDNGGDIPTITVTHGDKAEYELVEVPYIQFLDNGQKARFFRLLIGSTGSPPFSE